MYPYPSSFVTFMFRKHETISETVYLLSSFFSKNRSFQKKTAEGLADAYMKYINDRNLTIDEEAAGLDLNGDGDISGEVLLQIEYDAE